MGDPPSYINLYQYGFNFNHYTSQSCNRRSPEAVPLWASCCCILLRSPRISPGRGGAMDLKQSLILSLCKTRMSLYELRILIKIVEHGQVAFEGLFLKQNLGHIPHAFKHEQISFPVRDILSEGSQHYEQVRQAADVMCTRCIEYWDTDKSKWAKSAIIFDASCQDGVLSFYVSNLFWSVLYDFTRGFNWYELSVALSLPTPAAIRMYMFVNSQTHPISLSVVRLKSMLMCDDKYSQTADFIKRVVEPARKALDAAGSNSFTYTRLMNGRKVTHLTLTPVIVKRMHHAPADKTKFWAAMVSSEVKRLLIQEAHFTAKGLQSHLDLIERIASHPNAEEVLMNIIHRARVKGRSRGWIIQALRGEMGML